jgi:nucleotide-binding universal stress UspA family protein
VNEQSLSRLLVPVDVSECSTAAVDLAVKLATRYGSHIVFCSSVDITAAVAECGSPYVVADVQGIYDSLERNCADALSAANAKASSAGTIASTVELAGPAVAAILDAARTQAVQGIVMGTHGREGISRVFLGSVADGVLRRADVPVFVTSSTAKGSTFARIAVALDESDPADAALEFALTLATPNETTIVIVHAMSDNAESRLAAERLLTRAAERILAHGVASEIISRTADAARMLLEVAQTDEIDLVAIGTHGRRGLDRMFLGSVAEHVVRECPVPVVVLRGHAGLIAETADANLQPAKVATVNG